MRKKYFIKSSDWISLVGWEKTGERGIVNDLVKLSGIPKLDIVLKGFDLEIAKFPTKHPTSWRVHSTQSFNAAWSAFALSRFIYEGSLMMMIIVKSFIITEIVPDRLESAPATRSIRSLVCVYNQKIIPHHSSTFFDFPIGIFLYHAKEGIFIIGAV